MIAANQQAGWLEFFKAKLNCTVPYYVYIFATRMTQERK